VIVIVIATVIVVATVVVAALVNGNDSVAVMDTVDEGATTDESGRSALELLHFHDCIELRERIVAMLTKLIDP
jgi:hypothetical protein